MRKIRSILWLVGAVIYAAVFACLFELGWRTAYVWSYLDEKAPVSRILCGDTKMIVIALAAGLLLGVVTCLLAVRVRAFWTIRIGRKRAQAGTTGGQENGSGNRTIRISALAIMIILDLLLVIILGVTAYSRSRRYHAECDQISQIRTMLADEKRIYHAGGGVIGPDGQIYNYTNSLEAFQQSLERGVKFVELDFRFTTDGELVCIHKWNEDFVPEGAAVVEGAAEEATPAEEAPEGVAVVEGVVEDEAPEEEAPEEGPQGNGAVSLDEFLRGKIRGVFTPMTVEDVAAAMREYPDLHIVVDLTGDDVVRGYRMLAKRYPDLMPRLIPQFYHATQFNYLYSLGYRAMIFTLYRSGDWELSESALNSFAMRQMLVGITMGTYRVGDGSVVRQVLSTRQPVYIHTVDDPVRAQELFDMGVSAVYTNVFV